MCAFNGRHMQVGVIWQFRSEHITNFYYFQNILKFPEIEDKQNNVSLYVEQVS